MDQAALSQHSYKGDAIVTSIVIPSFQMKEHKYREVQIWLKATKLPSGESGILALRAVALIDLVLHIHQVFKFW